MITNGKEAGPWDNISVRNPWSEVWDVISWHQNRNTQVIEERTNHRPPDRKKYDTLMWGPTGRREDLDNVTKEKERERQRKELQIYMHNIMTKSRDKDAALSFYLCTKNILVRLTISMILKTYVFICLLIYVLQYFISLIQIKRQRLLLMGRCFCTDNVLLYLNTCCSLYLLINLY